MGILQVTDNQNPARPKRAQDAKTPRRMALRSSSVLSTASVNTV